MANRSLSRVGSRLAFVFALLILIASYQNCSDVNFSEAVPAENASSCIVDVEAIQQPLKILFIVDTSGSNVTPTASGGIRTCNTSSVEPCAPPTDPQKAFRGGTIQEFFGRYRHKSNFEWGFITFSDNQARAFITGNTSDLPAFVGDSSAMESALQSFWGTSDRGSTPYRSALQMAKEAIRLDPDLHSDKQSVYHLIMLTDGFPSDYQTSGGGFDAQALYRDIESLDSLAPGRTFLSTVYYGQINDPSAMALLATMAQKGNGQFKIAGDTSTAIRIEDLFKGEQGCLE